MESKKVAFVGSSTFNNYKIFKEFVNDTCASNNFTIGAVVTGGKSLADLLGERYADENGIEKITYPTKLKDEEDIFCSDIRNEEIIKNCDVCIAFWDEHTSGVKKDIELCKDLNKPCYIYKTLVYKSHFSL